MWSTTCCSPTPTTRRPTTFPLLAMMGRSFFRPRGSALPLSSGNKALQVKIIIINIWHCNKNYTFIKMRNFLVTHFCKCVNNLFVNYYQIFGFNKFFRPKVVIFCCWNFPNFFQEPAFNGSPTPPTALWRGIWCIVTTGRRRILRASRRWAFRWRGKSPSCAITPNFAAAKWFRQVILEISISEILFFEQNSHSFLIKIKFLVNFCFLKTFSPKNFLHIKIFFRSNYWKGMLFHFNNKINF